jgi:hypothetical protein
VPIFGRPTEYRLKTLSEGEKIVFLHAPPVEIDSWTKAVAQKADSRLDCFFDDEGYAIMYHLGDKKSRNRTLKAVRDLRFGLLTGRVLKVFQPWYKTALNHIFESMRYALRLAILYLWRLFKRNRTVFLRMNFTEVGFTGNVSLIDNDIAEKRNLKPLNRFERWVMKPHIETEQIRRKMAFRLSCMEVLGEDSDDW